MNRTLKKFAIKNQRVRWSVYAGAGLVGFFAGISIVTNSLRSLNSRVVDFGVASGALIAVSVPSFFGIKGWREYSKCHKVFELSKLEPSCFFYLPSTLEDTFDMDYLPDWSQKEIEFQIASAREAQEQYKQLES